MKQHVRELLDLTEQTCWVEDQNNYQNYRPSDSPKMIDLEEDSPKEEDSPGAEDSLEEEDTSGEAEYRQEDHQGAVGDHHHCPCHKPNKES